MASFLTSSLNSNHEGFLEIAAHSECRDGSIVGNDAFRTLFGDITIVAFSGTFQAEETNVQSFEDCEKEESEYHHKDKSIHRYCGKVLNRTS